jgi:hypothetical protein
MSISQFFLTSEIEINILSNPIKSETSDYTVNKIIFDKDKKTKMVYQIPTEKFNNKAFR